MTQEEAKKLALTYVSDSDDTLAKIVLGAIEAAWIGAEHERDPGEEADKVAAVRAAASLDGVGETLKDIGYKLEEDQFYPCTDTP